MPHPRSRRASSPAKGYISRRDSLSLPKTTPSLSVSSFSHTRARACPTADPERVVLLRGFYWRSSAADVRQICEEEFGPVRVVLLYQGELYPEAFADFVHRRHAAKCVIQWTQPTKIYRSKDKFRDGSSFINWAVGVIAQPYNPSTNDEAWARAWKERGRIERGEQPKEVLAPRWKLAPVQEGEERRIQKRYPQKKCSSAGKSKRRAQTLPDSGPPVIENSHPSPSMVDVAVVSDASMELDTALAGETLVGSPAPYSEDRMITVNVDDFLEKIVEDSDLAILSVAKAAIQRATQNFMDAVDEFDALMYRYRASVEVDNSDVRCSDSFRARETSIRGAAGERNSIGMVQALFHIQRMTKLDLRI